MEFILYLFVFVFGAIVGSFLNVVALRYNTSITILGRSFCFSCSRQLTWRDLFPIVSFLVLRGKCRSCKVKISWQYPAVELLTGIVFSLAFWKLGGVAMFAFSDTAVKLFLGELLFTWVVFALLIVIVAYDVKHKIIPDMLAYMFAALGFARLGFDYAFFPGAIPPNAWDFLAGPILAAPLALLWLVSRGRWIGLGDAKLTLGIGWFLGLSAGLDALLLGFWIGAVFGILLLALSTLGQSSFFRRKKITLKTEIPFAPFLILGLFLAFLGCEPITLVSQATEPLTIFLLNTFS